MATGIKRQQEPLRIVGDLLSAEITEKQARSIKYQLTVAIEEFDFDGTPVNEPLIRNFANGTFVADRRNAVLIRGTGTGKSHLAIAIALALIRNPQRLTWPILQCSSIRQSAQDRALRRQAGGYHRLPHAARLRRAR
ncbi:hypothetical protein MES5069_360176 [Mesorhizobium escarrei]|uniref:IstB-like ATP-binding domain-containing protein n=1 Tax=Mesorhizobium escarrei TaxID=666018 RepID=A0ABN8JYN2_9HYPH|nr:hypothetical protein MES5069_360176 [Mesorhizobium escarrei]